MKTIQFFASFLLLSFQLLAQTGMPSDQKATKETINLYRNLKKVANSGKYMFGHQDDLAYGVNWKYQQGRSDVKEVTGDYPAVYGWELGHLEIDAPMNLDSVPFDKMKGFIQEAYQRGGVITISWHGRNPMTGKTAWDPAEGTVASILPGGDKHDVFKSQLDKVAHFLSGLKGKNGESIPVLFRPFHEHTGGWFWWGSKTTNADEYKKLFRFTVDYLKNAKNLHNLLYVYNTGSEFNSAESFLQRYPGDDVVDIVSFDTYQYGDAEKDTTFQTKTNQLLAIIEKVAADKNKIAVLGETGYNRVPYAKWWTKTLIPAVAGRKIAYVLLWRNAGFKAKENEIEFYAPYKGHASAADFIQFYKRPETLFQKEVTYQSMYIANVHSDKKTNVPMYKNATQTVEARVKDLLEKMTVEEKAGQLNQLNGGAFTGPALNDAGQKAKMQMVRDGKVGTMLNVIGAAETKAIQTIAVEQSRLGIPLLFGYDVIHGYKTIFPIPLAEACSWDLAQIETNASIAAKEASAAGVNWTFAPMCDISNDPRWGRVMEGIGEDPWYGGLVSAARVKGLQGNLDNNHILACVKHYAAYGAVESGREYNYVDVSRVALWNKYLPPYKAAIEAGAATVMNGFNVFEGVPVSGSKYLVTDVLKNKWGFKGFLVSDWASFGEMVTWGYASDGKDAALKAFKAGSMIDMESKIMGQYLPELVKEGKISIQELDEAVGRILYYKFKLGLFEDPYQYSDVKRETATLFTAAHRKEALEAAKRSIVLLKNNDHVLPLKAPSQKIALIGHYAASKEDLFDFWIAQGEYKNAVTLQAGLQQLWDNNNISFSQGYNADATTTEGLVSEAVQNARAADVIVVNIGLSGKMAGEDRSLADPVVPQSQVDLLKALKQTGKPIVAVVSAGRPLVLTAVETLVDAIVYNWILGTEGGNAIAAVLSGAYNPSGKTVLSFPYAVGQIPVYYNRFNTGRPLETDGQGNWFSRYRDIPREPLYPFGYGLSYTRFTYSNLQLSAPAINKGEPLKVNVTVTNSGDYDGEEVVQLYIRDHAAAIIRPVKELKGFQKVSLGKGESITLTFELTGDKLSYLDETGNPVLEPGKFSVFVGGNSRDVLEGSFELKKVEL